MQLQRAQVGQMLLCLAEDCQPEVCHQHHASRRLQDQLYGQVSHAITCALHTPPALLLDRLGCQLSAQSTHQVMAGEQVAVWVQLQEPTALKTLQLQTVRISVCDAWLLVGSCSN